MMFLDVITISSLGWTVLAFFIVQAIAVAKFLVSLHNRVSITENDLKDNTDRDVEVSKITDKHLSEIKNIVDVEIRSRDESREKLKTSIFRELKRIEDKSDANDKVVMTRVDNIAQGLVKVETREQSLEKRVDRLEK